MEKLKGCIIYGKERNQYYDKDGVEILDGDTIEYEDGRREKVYLTESGQLGTDATNPVWIKNGRAAPCEYGIYPLEPAEMKEITKVKLEQDKCQGFSQQSLM